MEWVHGGDEETAMGKVAMESQYGNCTFAVALEIAPLDIMSPCFSEMEESGWGCLSP